MVVSLHVSRSLWQKLTGRMPVVSPEEANRQEVRERVYYHAVMALAARLATVDGAFNRMEIQTSVRALQLDAVYGNRSASLLMEASQDAMASDAHIRRIRQYYPGDRERMAQMMDAFFAIAACDGPLNAREITFLQQLHSMLEIPRDVFLQRLSAYILPNGRNAHQVLGVQRQASESQVKQAYREAMQAYHPDRLAVLGDHAISEMAHQRIHRLRGAYDMLTRKKRAAA